MKAISYKTTQFLINSRYYKAIYAYYYTKYNAYDAALGHLLNSTV
jgi:hypothetical protein